MTCGGGEARCRALARKRAEPADAGLSAAISGRPADAVIMPPATMRVRSELRAYVSRGAIVKALDSAAQQALLRLAGDPALTQEQGSELLNGLSELLQSKQAATKAALDAEEAWLAGRGSKPSKRPRSGLSKSRPQQAKPGVAWVEPKTGQRWIFIGVGGWVPHSEGVSDTEARARLLEGKLRVSELKGTWLETDSHLSE